MTAARLRRLLGAAALTLLVGCGYTFQGAQKALPGGATTLAVPILGNPTLEPELAPILTASIRDQFARTRAIRLVRTEDAQAILRGQVAGFSVDTVAFDPQGLALEYRATLTLGLTLTDPAGARIFWADPAVTGTDTYRAASDPLVTESNRREAVRRIAADIGRSVRDRILAGF